MIPKIIHYCWFGDNDIPEKELQCIETWKKILPDFTFILWNEDNMNLSNSKFAREAYKHEQYAFVSDYVRLFALYKYGGIYLDTDVEMLKPLHKFLKHNAFIGNETDRYLGTATIGATKNNKWVKKILTYYENAKFVNSDGSFNRTPNPKIITKITKQEFNWKEGNMYQVLPNDLHTYPSDYFCAKDSISKKLMVTENTHAIHHFSATWYTRKDRVIANLVRIIGSKNISFLSSLKKRIEQFFK